MTDEEQRTSDDLFPQSGNCPRPDCIRLRHEVAVLRAAFAPQPNDTEQPFEMAKSRQGESPSGTTSKPPPDSVSNGGESPAHLTSKQPASEQKYETCPNPECRTLMLNAPGIGPYCPNKECPVSDGAALWLDKPSPVLLSSNPLAVHLGEIENVLDRWTHNPTMSDAATLNEICKVLIRWRTTDETPAATAGGCDWPRGRCCLLIGDKRATDVATAAPTCTCGVGPACPVHPPPSPERLRAVADHVHSLGAYTQSWEIMRAADEIERLRHDIDRALANHSADLTESKNKV